MSFNNESTLACLGLNKDILLFDVHNNHIAKIFPNNSFENSTILDILWPKKFVKTRKKVEKSHHIILLTHERVFVYDYENQNIDAAIDVKNLNQHKICESNQKLFICNDNEILLFNMEGKLIKNLVLKNIVGHIINALSICSTEYQTYLITNTLKALQIWDVTSFISSKYSRHLKQSTEIQAILTIPLHAAKDDLSDSPLINITQLQSFIVPYKICNINNNYNNERIDHNNNYLVTNENTHFIDNSQSSSIFTSESDLDAEQKPSQNSRVLRSKRKVREKETTINQEDGSRSMLNGDKDTHINGHSQHLLSSTLQPDLLMNLIVQSTNCSENNNSLELWQIPFYSLNELNTTPEQNATKKSITKFVIPNATENTKILRINYKSTQDNTNKDQAAKPHLYVSATLNDGSLIIYSICLDENNLNSSASLNTPQNSFHPKWIIRYERNLLPNKPIICNGDYNINDDDDSTINNGKNYDLNVTKNVSPIKKVKKRKINNPETHNQVLPSIINLPIICAQFLCSEEKGECQSPNENGFTNNHKDNLVPRVILGYKNYVALKSDDTDALSVNSEDTDSNSINQQTRKSLRKSTLKKKAKTTTKTAVSTKFSKIPDRNLILLDEEPYELDSENPIIFETLNLETLTPGLTPNILSRDLRINNLNTNSTLNNENFNTIINKFKPTSFTNSTFIDGDNNLNSKPLEDFTKFFDEQDYVGDDENHTTLLLSQKTAETTTLDTLVNVSETSTKTLIANSPDTTLKIDETLPFNKSANIDKNHIVTQNINECVDSGMKLEPHINGVSSRVKNQADLPENDAMDVIGNEDNTMIETNYSYHKEESKLEHTQTSIISPKKLLDNQTLSKISNQFHTTSANQTSLSLRVKQILQEKKQNTSKLNQQNNENTKDSNNIISSTAILNNSTNHGFLTNETLKQPLKKLTNSVKSQNVIPQANTVITVLDQALKSGDLQKFTHIILINGRKEHIVRETMRNFPPAMLNPFMRQLGSSMTYAHTNEMMISLTWLDAMLQFHTSFIESNPKLGAIMFAMQDLLSQRILNTHKRLQLKGNIDYVKTQMFLRAQEDALHGQHSPNLDNQDAFVYYEDSDTEFEDNEQLMDDL